MGENIPDVRDCNADLGGVGGSDSVSVKYECVYFQMHFLSPSYISIIFARRAEHPLSLDLGNVAVTSFSLSNSPSVRPQPGDVAQSPPDNFLLNLPMKEGVTAVCKRMITMRPINHCLLLN